MTLQTKERVIGDLIKWETPHELCRENRQITRVAGATLPLVVGEMMEPDTAVAQIDTITMAALTADGGTLRLGYDGQWTTAMAWNVSAANAKIAFELLTTVTDTVTFSASPGATATTITWATAGHKSTVVADARLLTDGGVVMTDDVSIATTTPGTAVADMVICATGGNVTGVLCESVSLIDLQTDAHIERSFIVAGASCILNGDELYAVAAQLAAAIVAIEALAGVTLRYQPDIYQAGPPTS